ncbi:MAG: hypothetical protein E4G94_09050 [ANME-2 cluster archaeon]|nr:MAG: hypothetical protein E4G94_09050 [ANME-2 cluster archaeon]
MTTKKHVMSIIYPPKIPAVLSGDCTQSIRAGRNVSVDDEILFHTWDRKPYSKGSKWNNLKRVTVIEIQDIMISTDGIGADNGHILYPWNDMMPRIWAEHDFIDPPTGEALRDVLFGLNGAPKEPAEYQIIRWVEMPSCDNCITDCLNQMTEGDDGKCLSYKSKVV